MTDRQQRSNFSQLSHPAATPLSPADAPPEPLSPPLPPLVPPLPAPAPPEPLLPPLPPTWPPVPPTWPPVPPPAAGQMSSRQTSYWSQGLARQAFALSMVALSPAHWEPWPEEPPGPLGGGLAQLVLHVALNAARSG